MADGIKVFFSYSHKDEQLRDELAKHLSAMRRQGVIADWHDRKITAGNEWAGEIDENLNTAQIILLLVSADFLASDYCYDIELKRALERHEAGDARVIPVILRPVDWRGESFGRLQALPKDAKPVTSWSNIDEAFVDVARGLRTVIEERKAHQATSTRIKYRTHIVDQFHRGDFVTISEAIAAAKPGDKILVRPGLYNEGLVIDKPLEIVGDGPLDEIVIQTSGQHVISFKATRGCIANVTVRQTDSNPEWDGVDIAQGRLELEDSDISSQGGTCVGIHDGADPRVRRNRIHDSQSNGVFVYENGQGTLEDNEIFGNVYSSIAISTGGNSVVRRNRIYDGMSNGILVDDKAQGMLENNEIFGNTQAGVAIKTGGNPVVRQNRIYDGKSNGIYIYDNGQATIEDNEIFGNANAGVGITRGGNSLIRRNRIYDGKRNGVYIANNGQGTLEDNEIFGNAEIGIFITTSGNTVVRYNRIYNHKINGIVVTENGQGMFENNEIFENFWAGIAVGYGGNVFARRNKINKNGHVGIWITKDGRGTFEDNDLRENRKGAWNIDESSMSNVIRRNNNPNE